jgi:hypothetical protein
MLRCWRFWVFRFWVSLLWVFLHTLSLYKEKLIWKISFLSMNQ